MFHKRVHDFIDYRLMIFRREQNTVINSYFLENLVIKKSLLKILRQRGKKNSNSRRMIVFSQT